MRWALAWCVLVVAVTVGLMGVRGRIADHRPLMLIPDMDVQPRYDPQDESSFFADGRTMRTPPAGTVPFGGGDYASDAGSPHQNADMLAADDGFYRGKKGGEWVTHNPLPIDLPLLERGRQQFDTYCAVCHGRTGAGNGITTQYGLVGVASFHDDRLRKMPDGQIFHTITNGKGLMMPYGSQVELRDRWAIVAYVRALQRSQNATLADVPPDVRAEQAR